MVTLINQNFEENKKIYNKIEKELKQDLDIDVPITHVGSTAIPNMCGKNIIDILIGVKNATEFEDVAKKIENKGFTASMKSKTEVYQFFSSKNSETGSGDIHIHLVVENTERYDEFIILKKYLLNNEKEAYDYSNFKKEIIARGIVERKEYKAAKSEYVTELIRKAKKWYYKK